MRKIFFLTILIVALASFFASSHPDGLEKIAERLGFLEVGLERTALLGDYSLLTGIIGVAITFFLFWLVIRLLPRFDLK